MSLDQQRLDIIRNYFTKAGAGDASLLDHFRDDFDFHYYKFGIGKGKADFLEFHRRGGALIASLRFDIDGFRYIVAGDDIVVEGTEAGVTTDGRHFPDGRVSRGMFCTVFTFDGLLVSRMYGYADPDLTSGDADTIQLLYRDR